MKKLGCKFSIIIPLALVYVLLINPFTISIVELNLYLGYTATTMVFITVIVVWLCCSPFKESCCNGTWIEVLFNLVPIEVLLTLVFAQWHFSVLVVLLILSILIEIAFKASLRKDENRHRHSERVHRRYKDAFGKFMVLSLSITYMTPCLIAVFIYNFHAPTYTADEEIWSRLDVSSTESVEDEQQDVYQENLALLQCFESNRWSKYTIDERITLLQKLIDFEAGRLGIPTIPITAELLAGLTLGQYSNEIKKIWIDIEHLAKAPVDKCIQTVCHETFHSYQHYLVDNMDWNSDIVKCPYFSELYVWRENQADYKSAWVSGYESYEKQPLEVTARNYAEQETKKILSYIS